jgi:hypothetical protein
MKTLLLLLCLSVPAFGQSKFAGEYLGVGTASRWWYPERSIFDVYVYPSGSVYVNVFSYDLDWQTSPGGGGAIDARGKFNLLLDNGYLISARVSSSGSVRGTAKGDAGVYSFSCLRRFKSPYDPTPSQQGKP